MHIYTVTKHIIEYIFIQFHRLFETISQYINYQIELRFSIKLMAIILLYIATVIWQFVSLSHFIFIKSFETSGHLMMYNIHVKKMKFWFQLILINKKENWSIIRPLPVLCKTLIIICIHAVTLCYERIKIYCPPRF